MTRFRRCKTLGDMYSDEAIRERIEKEDISFYREQQKEVQQQIEMQQTKEAQQPIEVQENSGWINARRLHTADTYNHECEQLWQEIQQKYGYTKYTKETETGRRILVLGTEEFMYPALYVGAKLEAAG